MKGKPHTDKNSKIWGSFPHGAGTGILQRIIKEEFQNQSTFGSPINNLKAKMPSLQEASRFQRMR